MSPAQLIDHPTAGKCECDACKLAILWEPTVTEQQQKALLAKHKLRLVEAPGKAPAQRVNQSAALSWVEGKTKAPIGPKTMNDLEQSQHVRWISNVLRAHKSGKGLEAMFCVNPTRVLLSSDASAKIGDVALVDKRLRVDATRTARLRKQVAICVDEVCLSEGRTAIEAAKNLISELKKAGRDEPERDIKLENIPLMSPECAVAPARLEYVPNDPRFPTQWGMRRIKAPHAWNTTQGDSDIVVAVIDQGVELGHPDLQLHPDSWNATFDIPDGSPTGNHGTACAGIVAASIDNGQGVAGVAGRCRIMAIATATWADADIAEGLYFAADHGAHVVSMSFGVYPSWGAWDFDLIRDAMQYALERGLVLVAASGNENISESRFPGSDSRTICVGGSNREDLRKSVGDTSVENWWGASYGTDVDVVAPCLEISTTDRLGAAGYDSGDYFDGFNGTSAATPHVAGLAALILSLRPTLSNEEVREIIETTCDKVRPGTYTYGYVGHKPNGMWHEEVGYGLVNCERAVLVACGYNGVEPDDVCKRPCVEIPSIDDACLGPASPPWKDFDTCLVWYENRFVVDPQRFCQIRVVFEHCLRMVGRQQGPLLYTTTLLPGETQRLYTYDRYRRIRSETQRLSVHASLRQTVAALWESRVTQQESRYQELLSTVRSSDDSSFGVGGILLPFSFGSDGSDETSSSRLVVASTKTVSSQFQQVFQAATQQIDAERSIVVSTFEDEEHRESTVRTLTNTNNCRAVTYYVRRVLECYELRTRVIETNWRTIEPQRRGFGPWRSVDDLRDANDTVRRCVELLLRDLPKVGEEIDAERTFSVPTDGTVYEAELAYCPSCEPEIQAQLQVELERAHSEARRLCLEVDLLKLEAERRRALLDAGRLESFETPERAMIPGEDKVPGSVS